MSVCLSVCLYVTSLGSCEFHSYKVVRYLIRKSIVAATFQEGGKRVPNMGMAIVGVFNGFFENKSAQNGLKIAPSSYFSMLITNPVSDLLSDFAVSEQTVINVVLEVKTAPNGLKHTSYSTFGVLSTNPSSVSLPDFVR